MSTLQESKIDFNRLFFPRSIGIIGASWDPAGGGFFVRAMKDKFRGPMYLFNPRLAGKKLLGHKVYNSILEISEPIDYVILAVPSRLVPKLLEEVGQRKVPFCTIFSSGFREVGNETLENQTIQVARKYNIRIIGPNCIGVLLLSNPENQVTLVEYFNLVELLKISLSLSFHMDYIPQNRFQLVIR